MNLEDRLKKLIVLKFGYVNAFSIEIGLPYTTVRSILQRGIMNAKVENIIKIADGLNMKPEDLLNLSNEDSDIISRITTILNQLTSDRKLAVLNSAMQQLKEQKQEKNNVISLPVKKSVNLYGIMTAGYGTINYDKCQPIETIEIPENDIPKDYDLAFRVSGDSMYPTYEDGQIIFVRKQSEIEQGMIGCVEINGNAFIKRIYKEKDRLRFVSFNTDVDKDGNRLFPDFYTSETDEIYIIGKVVK